MPKLRISGDGKDRRNILSFMTEKLIRYQHCGEMHFLTFSCYRRLPYLATPEAAAILPVISA
jgi:hypothetical protein